MSVVKVTKSNFNEEVMESEKTVLVDFWAAWCGPCKRISPIVDEIAEKHPEIKVGKVNVDEEGELAAAYKIMSIPTLLVFKGGEVVNKMMGLHSEQEILDLLK